MSNIFKLNWNDVGGAVLSSVLVAVLAYVGNLTSLTAIEPAQLLNIVVLTAVASLAKALGTDGSGKFGGVWKVK